MGTSSSSRGSNGASPYIPPWNDNSEKQPVPDTPQRFRPFRTTLGQFVQSGDKGELRSALGSFAAGAAGGASTGAQRLSSVTRPFGKLVESMSMMVTGDITNAEFGETLSECIGLNLHEAIEKIADAVKPNHGDGELVRAAVDVALSEAFEDEDDFTIDLIDDDKLFLLVEIFLTESIFCLLMGESGEAFQKLDDPKLAIQRENELREEIKVSVSMAVAAKELQTLSGLAASQIADIEQQIIEDVLEGWEENENY